MAGLFTDLATSIGGDAGASTSLATDMAARTAPNELLNAYLVDYWDSLAGVGLVSGAVDTWTGQKLGIILSAAAAGNRPVYGADTGYFRGKSVVQAAVTGSKYLRILDYGSDIIANGAASKPYLVSIHRLRNTNATRSYALTLGPAAGTTHFEQSNAATTGNEFARIRSSAAANVDVSAAAAYTASACMREVWSDSTTSTRLNMGTTYTTAGAAGIATDIGAVRRIGVGARGDAFNPSDYSHRWIGLCSSKPPDALLNQVYRYFQIDSGI